jgi:hypothetical protein
MGLLDLSRASAQSRYLFKKEALQYFMTKFEMKIFFQKAVHHYRVQLIKILLLTNG